MEKVKYTKEDLEKAYNDGADKNKWYNIGLIGTVDEWDMKEPNFEKWYADNFHEL